LPAPQIDGVRVLPVVFLRHPLLRTRSVYNFFSRPSRRERVWALLGRKPVQPGSLAARLARGSGSFQDWVQEMIASEEGLTYLSNPQTRFLGGGLNTPARRLPHTGRGRLFDLDQAMANLSQVALLARTEHFDSDVRRFAPTLAASDLDLDLEGMVPRNITSDDFRAPLADRLRRLESQLGEALTEALYELQEQDSTLYAWAGRRLDSV
jgi:hypothetical protein